MPQSAAQPNLAASRARRDQVLDQIGEPPDGIGAAVSLGGPRRAIERRRIARQAEDLAAQALRRQGRLLDTPSATRFGKLVAFMS